MSICDTVYHIIHKYTLCGGGLYTHKHNMAKLFTDCNIYIYRQERACAGLDWIMGNILLPFQAAVCGSVFLNSLFGMLLKVINLAWLELAGKHSGGAES